MRKLFVLLLVFLLALTAVPVFAQGGDTATFTTEDGVTLDYPADWVADFTFGVFVIASDEATLQAFAPDTEGSVIVFGAVGTPAELTDVVGEEFDSVDSLRDVLVTSLVDEGGTLAEDTVINLGGRDVVVLVGTSEGITSVIYLVPFGDSLAFVVGQGSDDATLEANRPTIDAIVASMTYDPTAAPDPTDASANGGDVSSGPAQLGNGAFVYFNSLEQDTTNYSGLGTLAEALVLPDGTVYVDDGQSLWVLDVETGALGDRIENDAVFFTPDHWAIGPDGTFWGWDVLDGLVNLDAELNQLFASGIEPFGESYAQAMAVGPDGTIYVFVPVYDEEFNATGTILIFNSAGELQSTFVTNGEPDDFGFATFDSFLSIYPQADGNLLLIELTGDYKVVDTEGNLVDGPGKYGDEFDFVFAVDIDRADDGTLFMLTYDSTLRQYAPSGELVAEVGSEQADDDGPFALGELPTYGTVIALDSNRALVVGSNFNYSVVTLVDFSQAQ